MALDKAIIVWFGSSVLKEAAPTLISIGHAALSGGTPLEQKCDDKILR